MADLLFIKAEHYVTNFTNRTLVIVSLNDGLFADPQTIGSGVHLAIVPDGSYLINDNGDGNPAVLFLLPIGWSSPQNPAVQGIPTTASIASISPDGKYQCSPPTKTTYTG